MVGNRQTGNMPRTMHSGFCLRCVAFALRCAVVVLVVWCCVVFLCMWWSGVELCSWDCGVCGVAPNVHTFPDGVIGATVVLLTVLETTKKRMHVVKNPLSSH